MKARLTLACLVLAVFLSGLTGPGQASRAAGAPGEGLVASSGSLSCSWAWKKKKVVKWVWRQHRRKKIVRYRRVKVRLCHEVPAPAPARLGVQAREFGFTLSAIRLVAGDTIVELNNRGEDAHDLHVQRVDGGEEFATPETAPGDQARIRFLTTPGTYRLWCSLPYHAEKGMDTTFEAG